MVKFRSLWQKRFVPHIVAIVVYMLMVGLALDRLILYFGHALPGDGQHYDYSIFHWDLWWMRYALIELGTSPFETDFIIYPFTHGLVLHTFVPFWGLLSIPLQVFMKIDVILNTFIVVSFLLTAYFTFLFAHRHGSSWLLALLAGAFMAFTPAMTSRATQAHLNMLPMWWIPLSLLVFDLICRSRRLSSVLLLPICLYAALLSDLQYMMWIPLVLVPYAFGRFLSVEFRSNWDRQRDLLARLVLAVLLFAGLLLLYPIPQLLNLDTGTYPQATLKTPIFYSLPITSFFRPGTDDRTIGLLILPTTIAVWFLSRKQKGENLWLAIATISLLLALGPYPALEPYPKIIKLPLPYLALHRLLRGQYRCPVRFAVPAVFSLSIFIALKGRAVLDRLKAKFLRVGLVGGILCLLIIDYGLLRPFPVFFPEECDLYYELAEDPRDVVLLEVPFGIDTGYTLFGHGHQLIHYQSIHKKRIPSGALSRMSLTIVDYFRPFNLFAAMAGRADIAPVASDELTRLIQEWNVGYVFLHRDLLSQEELGQLSPFFAMHPSLCFWQMEGDVLAFRPRPLEGCPHIELPIRVDFGSPEDAAYIGTGWYQPERIGGMTGRWAGGISTATLRFDLRPQAYKVRFSAWAYPPDQVVSIIVNDQVAMKFPVRNELAVYTVTVPASMIIPEEPTYIQFEHAALLSAHEQTRGESPDQRPLGVAYEWLSIEPMSEE